MSIIVSIFYSTESIWLPSNLYNFPKVILNFNEDKTTPVGGLTFSEDTLWPSSKDYFFYSNR